MENLFKRLIICGVILFVSYFSYSFYMERNSDTEKKVHFAINNAINKKLYEDYKKSKSIIKSLDKDSNSSVQLLKLLVSNEMINEGLHSEASILLDEKANFKSDLINELNLLLKSRILIRDGKCTEAQKIISNIGSFKSIKKYSEESLILIIISVFF